MSVCGMESTSIKKYDNLEKYLTLSQYLSIHGHLNKLNANNSNKS